MNPETFLSNKNFEWHFERFKVTGLIENGQYIHAKRKMKLVRMAPLYFSTYEKAKTFFSETIHIGTLWTRNEEGARNLYSVTETRNMKWPEGARGL